MANPEHLRILKQGVEAWNRWREENPGIQPDLRLADLNGAELSLINFQEANLRSAKLTHANLCRANLSGVVGSLANFYAAVLREANLQGAFLTVVNLRDADLSDANLHGAMISGIDSLHGAVLRSAKLFWTVFVSVDLRQVEGLESVEHHGPSSIGLGVLEHSDYQIPDAFLRGCGISEDLIRNLPSPTARSTFGSYSSFISYSHSDKQLARRLHDQLQARGIRCWLDEHELKPGDRILDVVNHAIRLHDKILLCCSEASLNSWWVQDEIEKALDRERREGRDIIIPLNLDGYLLDGWESGQASTIRPRLAADFTGWEHDNAKFDEQFELLVKALQTDG